MAIRDTMPLFPGPKPVPPEPGAPKPPPPPPVPEGWTLQKAFPWLLAGGLGYLLLRKK